MATHQRTRTASMPATDTPRLPGDKHQSWTTGLVRLAREVLSNRGFVAGLVILCLLLYVHNGMTTIDYPEQDEATYFYRAFLLAHGNVTGANLFDPSASPLYIVYYAFCYLLTRTADVYPLVVTSSILLLGLGAYLLLSRIFHPVLSCVFALLVVAWTVPFAPNNLYTFATACLWLSLAVLGPRMWQRGLAAALVLLCTLVRAEFLAVALVLLVLLIMYETQRARRVRIEWRQVATAYAPAGILLCFGLYLYLGLPQTIQGASSYAVAWSYTDFYRWVHPSQFVPIYSYANPYHLFTKDFGPLAPTASFTATLLAMTRNPGMLSQYLGFESARLLAGFGTATLDGAQWHYDHSYTQPVVPTPQNTVTFVLGLAVFAVIALTCAAALRHRHSAVIPALSTKTPIVLGLVSLLGLVPLMVIINPHQRFYMLYPLVLLPIGLGVRWIGLAVLEFARVPRSVAPVARGGIAILSLAFVVASLPQPFAMKPASGLEDALTLTFLREHVPEHATIIGQPANSFADYLVGDGYDVTGYEAAAFQGTDGNVINNVLTAYPTLRDVYVLFNPNIPYQQNNPWFATWDAMYPELAPTLVAQRQNPNLVLYRLPPNLGARVNYLRLLRLVQGSTSAAPSAMLPTYGSVDFSAQLAWDGDRPQNNVTPQTWQAYGWTTQAIALYPDLPDAWAIRAHTVTTALPASWSGQTLIFAGAFAPWELTKQGADGTQLVFSIPGTTYHQVVQLPNTTSQHWHPILVQLPRYAGTLHLQVTVLPRSSLLWDDTLLSFVGVTASATTPPSPPTSLPVP